MTSTGKSRWVNVRNAWNATWNSICQFSRSFFVSGWDFVLPPACVACGTQLEAAMRRINSGSQLCPECCVKLCEIVKKPSCLRCGAPIGPYVDSRKGCQECSRERFVFKNVYRLGLYDGALRDAVLKGKYLGGEPLLMSLADLIWQSFETSLRAEQIELIVPIPQHWRQRIWRRHHAPDVLAEVWGRYLKVPVGLPILSKRRPTQKQAQLSRAARKRNQRDVYRVTRPKRVTGKTVLLVDDVLTTGATADSAARALKSAGAKKVVVVVVARVIGAR